MRGMIGLMNRPEMSNAFLNPAATGAEEGSKEGLKKKSQLR